MDAVLLKAPEGDVGLLVLDEDRDVTSVILSVGTRKIEVRLDTGEAENIKTDIAPDMLQALLSTDEMMIGHFTRDNLDTDDADREYTVPLIHL